jgi:hypothetical protein
MKKCLDCFIILKLKLISILLMERVLGCLFLKQYKLAFPVIAPGWSGHTDFLYAPGRVNSRKGKNNNNKMRPHFANIDFDLKQVQDRAVWEGVIQKDSKWAFAQAG